MGHRAPTRTHPRPMSHPVAPPARTRLVPVYRTDDLLRCARDEYVAGRIDVDEFEAAVDHILTGGRGCAEFSYLPRLPGLPRSCWNMEKR